MFHPFREDSDLVILLEVFTSVSDGLENPELQWGRISLFLFLALGVSFICSLLEAIILSVTWSHIELLGKDEKNSGNRLRRLKEDIELLGKSPSGINIYSFKYIGEEEKYQGVMAQEVLWASAPDEKGYYSVDYSKLDVDFKRLN